MSMNLQSAVYIPKLSATNEKALSAYKSTTSDFLSQSVFSMLDPTANTYTQSGKDGLNRNGAIQNNYEPVMPATDNPFAGKSFGSSLIDNFYTSIQNVALGDYAPTSILEQRQNYYKAFEDQAKPGKMKGLNHDYFA
ncbi:MAG: hypothetical protein PHX18_00850 [Candidatus Gastranaerophilales bacterium]|nr:hypothetical protein [Candidatus Gastranaerophilales bacterium]